MTSCLRGQIRRSANCRNANSSFQQSDFCHWKIKIFIIIIQNAAAGVKCSSLWDSQHNVTPLLRHFHYLLVCSWTRFKVLLSICEVLNNLGPGYLRLYNTASSLRSSRGALWVVQNVAVERSSSRDSVGNLTFDFHYISARPFSVLTDFSSCLIFNLASHCSN